MALVEMVLYHAQTPTGTIEWSTTSGTGPWTTATLSGPLPLVDALAEWAATVTAASGDTVTFTYDSGTGLVTLVVAEGGAIWIRLSETLAELLGFTTTVHFLEDGGGVSSDTTPTGIAVLPVSQPLPYDRESVELRQYRGARAAVKHWGRSLWAAIDLGVPADLRPALEGQPLVTGTCAVRITWDDADDWNEANPAGRVILYPIGCLHDARTHADEVLVTRIAGSMHDPGDSPQTIGSTAWAKLWGAVAYGYSPHYLQVYEGVPVVFCELAGDAIAPTDYTLDDSLVIDNGSPLGPVVTDQHVSAAYDQEVRLLDTTAVRGIMQRPTVVSTLRTAMAATDLGCTVESPVGWADVPVVYIGTSAEVVTSVVNRLIGIGTRGVYGRARSYAKGAVVSDKPVTWKGRRSTQHVALRDPTGRYVQGADVLSNAVVVFDGYVTGRPVRNGTEWAITARDQVRRLADPLGVAASGKAVWEIDDDGLLTVDALATVALEVWTNDADLESIVVRPFTGLTGTIRRSEARALIAAALEAAVTSGLVAGFAWRRGADAPVTAAGYYDVWALYADVTVTTADTRARAKVDFTAFNVDFDRALVGGSEQVPLSGASETIQMYMGMRQITTVAGVSLAVDLDNGNPAALPTAGYIVLEGDDLTLTKRYTSLAADDAVPSRVNVQLDATSQPSAEDVARIAEDPTADVSVKFYWLDSGKIYDILRRAIVSSGDAVNGAHDTLPKGQGLGLPAIDADSFPEVFDGFFRDLSMTVATEAGQSVEKLFGGLLSLSQRALTSRRNTAGTALEIAAVSVGSVDALPVATITDALLVSAGGRRPVRPLEVFAAPQSIEVKCRTVAAGDQPAGSSTITASDPHLVDWTEDAWDLEVYGLSRSALLPAAKAWMTAWFRAGENRQVVELDVPARIDAQPGDIVTLDLTDSDLWDYAEGLPGYSGEARVLGAQTDLLEGVTTLRVVLDGILSPGPMSPSLAIVAVNGTASSPTSIDVTNATIEGGKTVYDLLVAAKDGESTWTVLAYLPGQDAGRAEYTVSTVTLPGGGVARLTVTAYPSAPSVTLSTDYRLTWPVASRCTDDQARYLHNTDQAQWG